MMLSVEFIPLVRPQPGMNKSNLKNKHVCLCATKYCPLSDDITSRARLRNAWSCLTSYFLCPPSLFTLQGQECQGLHCSGCPSENKWRKTGLDEVTGFYPCHSCAACKVPVTKWVYSAALPLANKTLTCSSSNVIFLISCPCNKSPIASHFSEAGHSVSSMSFCAIQQMKHSSRGGKSLYLVFSRQNAGGCSIFFKNSSPIRHEWHEWRIVIEGFYVTGILPHWCSTPPSSGVSSTLLYNPVFFILRNVHM